MNIYRLATTLDPRFKLNWCQGSESASVRSMLNDITTDLSPQLSLNTSTQPPPPKRMKLTSFMSGRQVLSQAHGDK